MSRRKVGYDFAPIPTDIAPEWSRLPFQTRMLGIALWILGRGEPIPVPSDDWTTYLCGKLDVNGPDRPNIARALKRLVDAGLLVVCDGSATCLLRVCTPSAPCLHPVCGVSAERKSANTQQSHSTEEKRVEEKRESESARARESSARFEKPPIPPAPPELPPPERVAEPWLRVWELYAEHINLDVFQLPGAGTQERALRAIAASSSVESGHTHGPQWEAAVRRLLEAWNRDKWVAEHKPSIANLAANLHRYAAVKQKPILKVVDKCLTDAELLALDEWEESNLDYQTKHRRWQLIRAKEQREDADRVRAAGGAS